MKELITYIVHIVIAIMAVYLVFEFSEVENHFANIAIVYILVYFLLWLASYFYDRSHFVKVPRALGLLFYFLKELTLASLIVAWDVINSTVTS
jgi:multisubunit Na+/H+ antiporter MnhE subunit